jgi:imidazolonepropionase-like amidohydrolase
LRAPVAWLLALAALVLSGCKPDESSKVTAIIGAVLIDGNGGPPITDSVVVIAGSRIRSAGLRANVPIPAGSNKINGAGKFLVPGLIDVYVKQQGGEGVTTARVIADEIVASDSDAGRRRVTELRAKGASYVLLGPVTPPVAEAVLEEARSVNLPVTVRISTLAQAKALVPAGAFTFLGMIADTEEIDQSFVSKFRTLKLVFAPALAQSSSPTVMRNTRRLSSSGVAIAVGSGGDTHREIELLSEAGLSPAEILISATRSGAEAIGRSGEIGTVEPGRQADLLLLSANPLEDGRNLRKIDRVMRGGEWIE